MRRRALRWIADRAFRFSIPVALILVLITALAVSGARRLRLDTRLSDFLPPDSPEARAFNELTNDYRNLEPVVVEIRATGAGGEDRPIEVANALATLMQGMVLGTAGEGVGGSGQIARVVYRVSDLAQQYYENISDRRLIALLTEEDWEYLRAWAEPRNSTARMEMLRARRVSAFHPRRSDFPPGDPLGLLAEIRARLRRTRAPIPIEPRRGYFFTPEGDALRILVYPTHPAEDATGALRTTEFLHAMRDSLFRLHPEWRETVGVDFSGGHIDAALTFRRALVELAQVSAGALLAVLLLLLFAFRKGEAIVFTLAPPALGLIWTLGLAHAFCETTGINRIVRGDGIYTRVTGITLAFTIVLFGMGLSYSIHLYQRFTRELYRRRDYYQALETAFVETGRGILTSGATAALIFFLLFLTSFRGLKELGVLAGVATLCNVAACLLTVPTLAALKSRLARGQVHPIRLRRMRLSFLSEPAILAPRATLGAMLILTVVFSVGFGGGGPQVSGPSLHRRFPSIGAYLLTSRAGDPSDPQAATRPGRPLVAVVEGATIQEALERNDALYSRLASLQRERGAEIGVLAFDSLRVALPSLHTQQRSIETLKNLDLAPLRESIAIAGRSAGIQPAYAQRFLDDLASLQQGADEVRPIDYSSIWADAGEPFRQTVERLVTTGADGSFRVATPIFPGASGFAEEQLNALMAGLSGDRPLVRFIGDPMIERELAQRLKFDLALFALLGVAAIYLALLVHFKGARRATLAQAVILVQGLWVIGLMNAVGLRVHFMTLLALPLVVVLTLDNTLHLLQHYMDHRSLDVRLSVATLGRSVVLSCGAIAILYGALALTRDFRDLGLVAVFGAVSSVVGTMMLLPAAIKVWGRGQPLLSVLAAPEPPGGRGG